MAYWLVPEDRQLEELQQAVSKFASKYDGPDFVPHVTIYFGAFNPSDPFDDIVNALSSYEPLHLQPASLLFSDQFTQTCFIQFRNSPILSEMCEKVRALVRDPEGYTVVPHMSLFYGSLAPAHRREIEAALSLPESILFTSVRAIANPPQVSSKQDVQYWNERARSEMSGRPLDPRS